MNNFPVSKKTRPWNQPNLPVYSLSTLDIDTGKHNMNICTYVSAITMDTKRFMIGVYKGTKTYDNLSKSSDAILQILSKDNLSLVRRFGKKSGKDIDKLKDQSNNLSTIGQNVYLNNCISIMQLSFQKKVEVGDHDIFIFDVVKSKSLNHPKDILYSYDLKIAKIIG